jgi:hypothetical protein
MVKYPPRIESALRLGKVVVTLAPVVLVLWFLNRNLLLGPPAKFTFRLGTVGDGIKLDRPTDLVASASVEGGLRWRLAADSMRFGVSVPRGVQRVRLRLKLLNENQPVVTVAAQGRPEVGVIRQVVNYRAFNELTWDRVSDASQTLWQRRREYPSVQAFLKSPPAGAQVAVMGADPNQLARVADYRPASEPTRLPGPIRGRHTLLVYAQDEALDIRLEKQDLNRSDGADTATVRILDPAGRLKGSVPLPDDGVVGASSLAGRPQPLRITVPDVGTGIARVEIAASDDVLFSNIKSAQPYLAFEGRLFLAQGPAYPGGGAFRPVQLLVTGRSVSVQTPHREALQRFRARGRSYALDAQKRVVTVDLPQGETQMDLPRGDILVETDGRIALAPARMVPSATAQRLDPEPSPNLDRFDFILANYVPRETNGPQTVTLEYEANQLQISGRQFHFVLGAPGIRTSGATLGLDRLDATLYPEPLRWSKLAGRMTEVVRKFFTVP